MAVLSVCLYLNAGVVIFFTYALVQVTQVADATATFAVYDSDNYPQVSAVFNSVMQLVPWAIANSFL